MGAREIVKAHGGDWRGSYGVVPGPGHSDQDRSLKVWQSGAQIYVHSFAGDDWKTAARIPCRRGRAGGASICCGHRRGSTWCPMRWPTSSRASSGPCRRAARSRPMPGPRTGTRAPSIRSASASSRRSSPRWSTSMASRSPSTSPTCRTARSSRAGPVGSCCRGRIAVRAVLSA